MEKNEKLTVVVRVRAMGAKERAVERVVDTQSAVSTVQ
jgi:hypothetical protein